MSNDPEEFGPLAAASGSVVRTHKGEQTKPETSKDELIDLKLPPIPPGSPVAQVGVKFGRTFNTGDYNSVRMDVSISVPCEAEPTAIRWAYEAASAWAEEKIAKFSDRVESSKPRR